MLPLVEGDPRQVGPYRLHSRLGSGGMGQVFLGHSPGGRPVAVKLVRPELADDADFRRRFAREVVTARKVGGFYTAQVVDADPDAAQPWLVTAYVPGPSLEQAVQRCGYLPEQTVRVLGAGLAEGLAAIHRCGIVHRDLKPSNVLLATDGPRVIDFGIAYALETSTPVTRGIGTPAFMSPEQIEGRTISPASDIFSLGTVLAYAATGTGPFGSGPHQGITYRIMSREPDLGHLPPALVPLVAACLTKDPSYRPSLNSVLHQLAVPATGGHDGWLPPNIADMIGERLQPPPQRSDPPAPWSGHGVPGLQQHPSWPAAPRVPSDGYAAPSPPGGYAVPAPAGGYATPPPSGGYAAASPQGGNPASSPQGGYSPFPHGGYATPPPSGGYGSSGGGSFGARAPRRRPGRRPVLLSAVTALLLVAGGLVYAFTRPGGGAPPVRASGPVTVTGHLVCQSGQGVSGAWVATESKWTSFASVRLDKQRGSGSSSYRLVLPTADKYRVKVGCGISAGGGWGWGASIADTRLMSGTDNSLRCDDVPDTPGYGSCTPWVGATPAPTRPTGAVDIAGEVACRPKEPVTGVYVFVGDGSSPDSDFAYIRPTGDAAGSSSYSYTLPSDENYTVHVGCGGNVDTWGTPIDNSPTVHGTGHSFMCSTTQHKCSSWNPSSQ
ncbi:protein kinase [Streptomyces sp. SL13]|uniref:Protein kinase n=1 Tax=Streptantibioticus silvisoli TaxID=2705255 RepID=A0AA90H062_9ACTN|nr:serine/threonine protein kinase [Streptantibioticus silvisoli]MDI5968573.1 protein kinase [Streptantibioticus silvisoli]